MLITLENTKELTSSEFIDKISIELWDEDNTFLITEPKKASLPNYFYITAYLVEFETEFQMSGLVTLLSNSSAYNFENTLISLREIGCARLVECLKGILGTLNKFGMSPSKMREHFLSQAESLPENSIVTSSQFFNEHDLLEELQVHDDKLSEIYSEIWPDLEKYLIEVRGK